MTGDHIRALKGGQWIHAIDCGDQRVIHLLDQPGLTPGERLRRSYRPEFVAGASAVELVVHRERTFPPKAVVARAYSRLADPSVVAMFEGSEQFAAWCKTGRVPEAAPATAAAPPVPPAARPAKARKATPARKGSSVRKQPKAAAAPRGEARPARRKPAVRKSARPVARPKPRPRVKPTAKAKPKAKARPGRR